MISANMGSIDRVLRSFVFAPTAILAAILVGAGSVLGIVLFVLAAVMLATSAVGFCPLYKLVGLDTHSLHRPRDR